jgi:hypothetical protein
MSSVKYGVVLAALLLGVAASAKAQLGVYGEVTGERISSITCVDPQHECASNDGVARPYGAEVGAQYDFRNYGPVLIGFDVRGYVKNSNKSAAYYLGSGDAVRDYGALGGVRATFHTPYKLLRPYAEVAAGLSRTNAALVAPEAGSSVVEQYQDYTKIEGLVGLDLALFPMVDIRAIEFGAGEMFGPSSHPTQQIGVGIVFHLTR